MCDVGDGVCKLNGYYTSCCTGREILVAVETVMIVMVFETHLPLSLSSLFSHLQPVSILQFPFSIPLLLSSLRLSSPSHLLPFHIPANPSLFRLSFPPSLSFYLPCPRLTAILLRVAAVITSVSPSGSSRPLLCRSSGFYVAFMRRGRVMRSGKLITAAAWR